MQIRHNPLSGGYCGGVPPLPIPNREVKPTCADGTAMQCGRVGRRLLSMKSLRFRKISEAFLFFLPADLFLLRWFFLLAEYYFVTQISQMTQNFSHWLFKSHRFHGFPQIFSHWLFSPTDFTDLHRFFHWLFFSWIYTDFLWFSFYSWHFFFFPVISLFRRF